MGASSSAIRWVVLSLVAACASCEYQLSLSSGHGMMYLLPDYRHCCHVKRRSSSKHGIAASHPYALRLWAPQKQPLCAEAGAAIALDGNVIAVMETERLVRASIVSTAVAAAKNHQAPCANCQSPKY